MFIQKRKAVNKIPDPSIPKIAVVDHETTVKPKDAYPKPTFKASIVPLTMQFTDTTSGAVKWAWSFGDGETSTEQNPSHIYQRVGTFTVTLQVWFKDESSSSLVQEDYVTVQ